MTRRIAKKLLSLGMRQGVQTEAGVLIKSRLTQGALQRSGLIDMRDGHIVLLNLVELSRLVGADETWW